MQCPYCSRKMVQSAGAGEHDYLVVGKAPGDRDVAEGAPFTGLYGQILRNEFNRAGLSFDMGTYTNFWLHQLDLSMWEETDHMIWHRSQLMKEIVNHDNILMLGTDLSRMFMSQGVAGISGIPLVSTWFPSAQVIFLPEPMSITHGGVGEFRLGVEKFHDLVSKPDDSA